MVIVSKFIIILHYKFVIVTPISSVIIEVAVGGGIRSNSGLGYFFLIILSRLFLVYYENKGGGLKNRVKNLRLSFPNLRRFFFELL